MKRIHIVGGKNHGKTTLVVDLVQHFLQRGLRVATIKHTHHTHELDTPGKDSHRHREAGAEAVGIVAGNMNALFWPTTAEQRHAADKYDAFTPLLGACDLVLVEGDLHAPGMKIEVWRSEAGGPPRALEDASILAVVSDDAPGTEAPVFPRSDLGPLGDFVADKLALEADSQ